MACFWGAVQRIKSNYYIIGIISGMIKIKEAETLGIIYRTETIFETIYDYLKEKR